MRSSLPLACVAIGFFFFLNSLGLLLPVMWEDANLQELKKGGGGMTSICDRR